MDKSSIKTIIEYKCNSCYFKHVCKYKNGYDALTKIGPEGISQINDLIQILIGDKAIHTILSCEYFK